MKANRKLASLSNRSNMASCFLFIHHLDEVGCLSLSLNNHGQVIAPLAQRPFSDIKTIQENSETIIILPSARSSLHQLELPWLPERKARAAIPFALEELLAQPIDSLHFSFNREHYSNGHYLIAVSDKVYLEQLLGNFEQQQITIDKITLDWFALKPNEMAVTEQCLLVNAANFQGAISEDFADFHAEQMFNEVTSYYFSDSNQYLLAQLPQPSISVQEQSYLWIAKRLQKLNPLNFCQGDLQCNNNRTKTMHWYQIAAGMCFIWLASFFIINGIKLHTLNQKLADVDTQINTIYREFFPQATQVISPKFRISQLLKHNQSNPSLNFWALLQSSAINLENSNTVLEQLRFQNQTVTLTLTAKNFEDLAALQLKLQRNKLKVKQTQAATKDTQVVSILELSR